MAGTPSLVLLAGAVLAVAACGDNLRPEETLTLPSTAALDGFVYTGPSSFASAAGGGPGIGDIDASVPNLHFIQFFSYDLSTLPADAEIQTATLRLNQANVTTGAFTELGNVLVDHVDYGASLDVADDTGGTLTANIGTLSTNETLGYKELVVTARVAADQGASRTRSQFRVRFTTDGNNDGTTDFLQFTDQEGSTGGTDLPPQLVIVFRRPQ